MIDQVPGLGQANIQAVEKLMQTKHSIFYQILEKSVRIQYQGGGERNHIGPTLGKERVIHGRSCEAPP